MHVYLLPKNQRCKERERPGGGCCLATAAVRILQTCQPLRREGRQGLRRWTGCRTGQTVWFVSPGVGGLRALSNPSVNTSSTERQPMGFSTSCFFYIQIHLLPTARRLHLTGCLGTPSMQELLASEQAEGKYGTERNHPCCQGGRCSAP